MPKTNGNLLKLMDAMIERAQLEKAAANLDLASDGKTSHPSANVADGTRPASEGERSSENSADVKKDVPNNVEEAGSKNTPGDSKKPTDTMGTQSMSSDESRAGNVDTPKGTPSMASNAAVGPNPKTKYSADQLVGEANSILAEMAKILDIPQEKAAGEEAPAEQGEQKAEPAAEAPAEQGEAQETPAQETAPSDPPQTQQDDKSAAEAAELYKKAAEKYPEDEEAGYVAASMLIDYLNGQEKSAGAQDAYSGVVSEIIKTAEHDADTYAAFMDGYQKSMTGQTKKAQDPAALMGAMGGMGGMGGGAPPADMGGGGAAPDPAALAALAGGGPEGAMAGGEGGGMGGEELDDEAVIEALAEALDQAGITPEELAEVVAEAQGGAPAEAAEGEAEAEAGEGMEEAGEAMEEAAGAEEGKEAAAKPASQEKKAAAASSKTDALKDAVRKLVRG
jgi:hypothetical protein